MLELDQVFFRLPHIARAIAPSSGAIVEMRYLISGYFTGFIDIGIVITPGKIAQCTIARRAPVQPLVPRQRDGAPTAALFEHIDDMIKKVLAFKAHDQRRIAVMFKDGGGGKRGLETMQPSPPKCFFRR